MFALRSISFVVVVASGFLASADASEPNCASFTAAKCTPPPDTVIPGGLPGLDEATCQKYCEETANCLFYRHDKYNEQYMMTYCELLTDDYRQNCGVYGADLDTPLDVCILKTVVDNTCDDFISQDCDYSLVDVALEAVPGTIVDPGHCQDLCGIMASSLECRYWVFQDEFSSDDKTTHCTLYKSMANIVESCNSYHGPATPLRSMCGPIIN